LFRAQVCLFSGVESAITLISRNAIMLKFNRSSHVSSTFLVYFLKTALVPDAHQLQICFVAPETLANWGILLKAVLRQANHSSREVLSTVVRRWVWSRNLVNEEALTHWGLLRQIKKTKTESSQTTITDLYHYWSYRLRLSDHVFYTDLASYIDMYFTRSRAY